MSDTTASLRRKIAIAGDLQGVVRTMKTLAASSIGQYERSVAALADYARAVDEGLSLCLRQTKPTALKEDRIRSAPAEPIIAVVFGSDQGLVGRFNEAVADHAIRTLSMLPGKHRLWAVGEQVHARLADAGLPLAAVLGVPASIQAITPLIAQVLDRVEALERSAIRTELHLFHHRPDSSVVYTPVHLRLLPLDERWAGELARRPWPGNSLPEILGDPAQDLRALIREYVFVSIFRACAESLASENASRLAAMERADRNIGELLETLQGRFHHLRQAGIDAELFDVIAGYEALGRKQKAGVRTSNVNRLQTEMKTT